MVFRKVNLNKSTHIATSIDKEGLRDAYQDVRDDNSDTNCTAKGEEVGSVEAQSKPKISTLVFMELETTGLPMGVTKESVQITEMCMVAIDRLSFERDTKLRVLNKINLCIQPRSEITFGAMEISGLYNEMLENQPEFDHTVPPLLECFFSRLRKPICLLAHYGNRFDFPILQAELNRINHDLDPDIMCADTLAAFRAIRLLVNQVMELEERENDMKEKAIAKAMQQNKKSPVPEDKMKPFCGDSGSSTALDVALNNKNFTKSALNKASATKSKPEMYSASRKVIKKFLPLSLDAKTSKESNAAISIYNSTVCEKHKKCREPKDDMKSFCGELGKSTPLSVTLNNKNFTKFALNKPSATENKPEMYTISGKVIKKFLPLSQKAKAPKESNAATSIYNSTGCEKHKKSPVISGKVIKKFLPLSLDAKTSKESNAATSIYNSTVCEKHKMESIPILDNSTKTSYSDISTTTVVASPGESILEVGVPKISESQSKPENYATLKKLHAFKKNTSSSEKGKSSKADAVALKNLSLDITPDVTNIKTGSKRKASDSSCTPKKKYKYTIKKTKEAKRKLVFEEDHDSLELHEITSFSLKNLYDHFFHEFPSDSHTAENDCMNLTKICQKVRKNFLNWIDENSVPFSSVKAMW